jgi:hypothetical protein
MESVMLPGCLVLAALVARRVAGTCLQPRSSPEASGARLAEPKGTPR